VAAGRSARRGRWVGEGGAVVPPAAWNTRPRRASATTAPLPVTVHGSSPDSNDPLRSCSVTPADDESPSAGAGAFAAGGAPARCAAPAGPYVDAPAPEPRRRGPRPRERLRPPARDASPALRPGRPGGPSPDASGARPRVLLRRRRVIEAGLDPLHRLREVLLARVQRQRLLVRVRGLLPAPRGARRNRGASCRRRPRGPRRRCGGGPPPCRP